MLLRDLGIEYKTVAPATVAVVRRTFSDRKELAAILSEVKTTIPAGLIDGPGFCVFRWVTSVCDGFDGEIGYPVHSSFDNPLVTCRTLGGMQVLSLVHRGPIEGLRGAQRLLFGSAADLGIVSDEFMREVYLDADNPLGQSIELQFVIHDWPRLLTQHTCRVLGRPVGSQLATAGAELEVDCGVGPRFDWLQGVMRQLGSVASEAQVYDILSSCAHVYPSEQLAKLRRVYEEANERLGDPLAAIDAVLDFMSSDPGWSNRPRREGRIVLSSKQPRDPAAYAAATTKEDRARAYCFCPMIRERLGSGMPASFCNCGAGWFRQQWEAALGRPVRVRIVESLLQGDERCTFAIELPEHL